MEKQIINLDKSISGHVQKKWQCPSCGKKRFVRFYNFTSNEYLGEQYGRCDREDNCGYYFSPFQDKDSGLVYEPRANDGFIPKPLEHVNYVDSKIVGKTLNAYDSNTFVKWLIDKVGSYETVMSKVFEYLIGTAKNNGTIFWQIDQYKRVRTGTKIHYDETGHRIKTIDPQKLFKQSDNYKSCLFGEHLLFNAPRTSFIALVESEKSAIIASLYFPTLGNRPITWLASSGSNGLTDEKIQCLRGRDIILVPDFSYAARAMWGSVEPRKAKNEKGVMMWNPDGEIQPDYVSAKMKLERIDCRVRFYDPFPELEDGSDVADYFIQEKAQTNYEMPDLSQFDLSVPTDFKGSYSDLIFDWAKTHRAAPKFRWLDNGAQGVEIECNNPHAKKYLEEKMAKNPMLLKLVKMFDLCEGQILQPE